MEKKAFDLITFGEIMLRLSPPASWMGTFLKSAPAARS